MQPLKRFTQCGSLTMLFGVFIVLFGVSSTALTTFGKSNPNNNPPPPTIPPIKGRECNIHNDCAALQQTSCVLDPYDDRLRCLCGDNHPPANGYCPNKHKALRHICNETPQCEDGMICAIDNSTKTTTLNYRSNPDKVKVCLCDEELGYIEKHNVCNGSFSPLATGTLIPFVAMALGLLIGNRFTKYY